jgi:hypothetical protein
MDPNKPHVFDVHLDGSMWHVTRDGEDAGTGYRTRELAVQAAESRRDEEGASDPIHVHDEQGVVVERR